MPLVAAAAVVLLFLGCTTAYAAWSQSVTVGSAGVSTGTFGVQASSLDIAPMYPGETRTGVITLSRTAGTQGRWVYSLAAPTATGTLSSQLTVTVYPTAACTGTAITVFPWAVPTTQALAATPQHCVSVRLAANAPSTTQGATATVTLPVTAENRTTN
jgi:hypothetical protein